MVALLMLMVPLILCLVAFDQQKTDLKKLPMQKLMLLQRDCVDQTKRRKRKAEREGRRTETQKTRKKTRRKQMKTR